MLIASLVVSAGLSALGRWWAPLFGSGFGSGFGFITRCIQMSSPVSPRVRSAATPSSS